MSDIERQVLCVVRCIGPCSNADVGRRMGIAPDRTYPIVKSLELKGLLVHPKKQAWDISELGRDFFGRLPFIKPRLYQS